ncbi:MAG: response regulator transcription factor [Ignavibacteriaceae bacterium]
MINVVIADPVFLVREGLKKTFERNNKINLAGEIKSRQEFWNKLSDSKPDILITDFDYDNFIDIDEMLSVFDKLPDTNIVVISNHSNKENIIKVIKNGVLGFLTKECNGDEIIRAVNSVSNGEKFFCNKVLDVILEKHYNNNRKQGKSENLSDREIEIIRLIVEGCSNQDIAEKLFLSIHTVYTHRKNIMKKLKFKSPVELVLYALNSGIVNSSE